MALTDPLSKSPSCLALHEALNKGASIVVESLWDAVKALVTASILQTQKKSILFVTSGVREDRILDNLESMIPGKAIDFPAWETLPGEAIPPSPDIIGQRFEALRTLLQKKESAIVLCPVQSLLQKLLPKEDLLPFLITWTQGTRVSFNSLPKFLTDLGYRKVSVVADKGQFAIRGGIVDLFCAGCPDPFRIEFLGDEIGQIRTFDPVGQKSIGRAEKVWLAPVDEMMLLQCCSTLSSIGEYLGPDFVVVWDDIVAIEEAYTKLQSMPGARSPLLYSFQEMVSRFSKRQQIFGIPQHLETLSQVQNKGPRTKFLQPISFETFGTTYLAERWYHLFQKPSDYFVNDEVEGDTCIDFLPKQLPATLFINANITEEEEIKKQLAQRGIDFSTSQFAKGYLTGGWVLPDLPWAVLPNAELTGRVRVRRQKWRGSVHTPASEFHQLVPGDLVVHFHSGIGRYLGIEKQKNHLGEEAEFLLIQYAESSKMFVPMSQAYLVSRYIGAREEAPVLSQLGSKRWQTVRQNAEKQIAGYAQELLKLYARRTVEGGFRYPPDGEEMLQFEHNFPYEATGDQQLAINAIKQDMTSDKPMDRLICGDVGYGKTEVAMRAAFKAVADGHKQVAVLVPTTVLAMQHYRSFSERMHGLSPILGVVSRFQPLKENRKVLERVANGEVDILIGTHRLLSEDVKFKDLGLLIIDEEQRFGVRAKEKLKHLQVGVDCLTLSATPIPRTLYLSVSNARDMSLIGTPPQDRLPVKSIIAEGEEELIQNALLREFARGGQAFYIHNRVETIVERANAIQKLVPSARCGIAHGQMDAEDIDRVFHQFQAGDIDLLFSTTLIENGVDIPNANTIIIERADTYGLADLYQLRGRVGRWNRAAYAYFLIPKNANLPEPARKRLQALAEAAGGYGGGMRIAMRDLEIRGAGDLLGVQQSGQVSSIGFHLYCKLLKRAVGALKKGGAVSFVETKFEHSFDARIPDTYIDDASLRMELYWRFGETLLVSDIESLYAEIQDRFGPPPEPVLWLYHLARLRVLAVSRRIVLLRFNGAFCTIEGAQDKPIALPIPKPALKNPAILEEMLSQEIKNRFK